mmetsp:Transcript_18330/g.39489  ORF Transcript_18330/g.39489 Transcript_18330/m.39489 type:complete len:116 (+) Transcript_18330:254-601(+)
MGTGPVRPSLGCQRLLSPPHGPRGPAKVKKTKEKTNKKSPWVASAPSQREGAKEEKKRTFEVSIAGRRLRGEANTRGDLWQASLGLPQSLLTCVIAAPAAACQQASMGQVLLLLL